MMWKCSIFVSAICSSIFRGNDLTLAERTLSEFGSVFGCVCVFSRGGRGGAGIGGVGGGGDGGGWGGEWSDGLFMEVTF